MSDKQIEQVQYLKYLGVMFDSHLDFNHHFTLKCSYVKRHLAASIRIFRKSINLTAKRLLYTVLLRCHLLYGIEAIYPRHKADRVSIERVNKFACRYITNNWSWSTSYVSLLTKCNLSPIFETVLSLRLTLVHSYVTNRRFCHPDIIVFGQPNFSSRVFCQSHRLAISIPRNPKFYQFFIESPHYSIVSAYNLIQPHCLVNLPLSQFKKSVTHPSFVSTFMSSHITCESFKTHITSFIDLPPHPRAHSPHIIKSDRCCYPC